MAARSEPADTHHEGLTNYSCPDNWGQTDGPDGRTESRRLDRGENRVNHQSVKPHWPSGNTTQTILHVVGMRRLLINVLEYNNSHAPLGCGFNLARI